MYVATWSLFCASSICGFAFFSLVARQQSKRPPALPATQVLPSSALEEDDPEAATHASFAAVRRRLYMAPEPLLDAIDRFVSHAQPDSRFMVIEGTSGSGKSSLTANWIHRRQQRYKQDHIFYHFIGCDANSTRLRNVLGRLLVACASSDEEAQQLDNLDLESMVTILPKILEAAAARVAASAPTGSKMATAPRLVLVLDAVNQLENESFAWLHNRQVHRLGWLPLAMPENVRVIISTLPGPCQEELRTRRCCRIETYPLARDDCETLIEKTMAHASKSLDQPQVQLILASDSIGNPLFLKLLLEELIAFGEYFELTAKIKELASCTSIPALLEKILQRLERSFEQVPVKDLVGQVFRFIGVGREGIMDSELQSVCGVQTAEGWRATSGAGNSNSQDGQPSLSPFMWSSFYFAIRHLLVDKSGGWMAEPSDEKNEWESRRKICSHPQTTFSFLSLND